MKKKGRRSKRASARDKEKQIYTCTELSPKPCFLQRIELALEIRISWRTKLTGYVLDARLDHVRAGVYRSQRSYERPGYAGYREYAFHPHQTGFLIRIHAPIRSLPIVVCGES